MATRPTAPSTPTSPPLTAAEPLATSSTASTRVDGLAQPLLQRPTGDAHVRLEGTGRESSHSRHAVDDPATFSLRGTAHSELALTGTGHSEIALRGTASSAHHVTPEAPDDDEAKRVGELRASIGNSDPAGVAAAAAKPEPTTTVAARVKTGVHIVARDNHYYDPISRKFLTLHFGSEVPRENWQACTEDLVGSVCARIELLLSQKNAQEGLRLTFKDVKAYQFDWKRGEVSVEFTSGGSYTFSCAGSLIDAMRPHLRDPKQLEKLATPAAIETGLHAIDPPLEPIHDAFIHRLAFDRGMVSKLENAIRNASAPNHAEHNSPKIQGYKSLLHLFHALRHGVRVSLNEQEREALKKMINTHLASFSSLRKLSDAGNTLLNDAIKHFCHEVESIERPPQANTTYASLHLNQAVGGGCVNLSTYLSDPRHSLLGQANAPRYVSVDIDSAQRQLSSSTPALAGKPTLHLEPVMNITQDRPTPTWARVTSVVCHASGEVGSKSKDASYVHFTCDDEGNWWRLAAGKAEQVKWSQVQQAAAISAVHVGLDIDPVVRATLSAAPTGLNPSATTRSMASTHSAAALPMLVLDTGTCHLPDNYARASWSSLPPDHASVQALSALRTHQGHLLTQDDGPKTHHELWRRFYPVLQPALITQESELYEGTQTLSASSKATVQTYFNKLGTHLTSGTSMDHSIPQAVTHGDLQEMANLSGKNIQVYTNKGTVTFTPTAGAPRDEEPLRYASPSLDVKDPNASCFLTPVLQADEVADLARPRSAASSRLSTGSRVTARSHSSASSSATPFSPASTPVTPLAALRPGSATSTAPLLPRASRSVSSTSSAPVGAPPRADDRYHTDDIDLDDVDLDDIDDGAPLLDPARLSTASTRAAAGPGRAAGADARPTNVDSDEDEGTDSDENVETHLIRR